MLHYLYSLCKSKKTMSIFDDMVQVNLCQNSEALLVAEHRENMLCTTIVLNVRNNFCTQHVLPRFELGIFMYWTCNSMNNLSSYCGLVNGTSLKIRASDKDLPVRWSDLTLWTSEVTETVEKRLLKHKTPEFQLSS